MQQIQLLCLHKRMKEMVDWLTGHPWGGGIEVGTEGNQWDLTPARKSLDDALKFRDEGALWVLPSISE